MVPSEPDSAVDVSEHAAPMSRNNLDLQASDGTSRIRQDKECSTAKQNADADYETVASIASGTAQ